MAKRKARVAKSKFRSLGSGKVLKGGKGISGRRARKFGSDDITRGAGVGAPAAGSRTRASVKKGLKEATGKGSRIARRRGSEARQAGAARIRAARQATRRK